MTTATIKSVRLCQLIKNYKLTAPQVLEKVLEQLPTMLYNESSWVVYGFGSFWKPGWSDHSDIDILVVCQDPDKVNERLLRWSAVLLLEYGYRFHFMCTDDIDEWQAEMDCVSLTELRRELIVMDKEELKQYMCSIHGANGNADCLECWNKLGAFLSHVNAYLAATPEVHEKLDNPHIVGYAKKKGGSL